MSKDRYEQPSPDELNRINEILLQRVARARAAYQEMKRTGVELRATRESVGTDHPDGTQASLNALRMERAITQEYTDAVKALTDFTLNQKIPSERERALFGFEAHSPTTGHFKCRCGESLVFGTEPSAHTLLVNQRQDANRKTGECPRCGCLHEIPPPPSKYGGWIIDRVVTPRLTCRRQRAAL